MSQIWTSTATCGKRLHKACRCIRPAGHVGECNCANRDGTPVPWMWRDSADYVTLLTDSEDD